MLMEAYMILTETTIVASDFKKKHYEESYIDCAVSTRQITPAKDNY